MADNSRSFHELVSLLDRVAWHEWCRERDLSYIQTLAERATGCRRETQAGPSSLPEGPLPLKATTQSRTPNLGPALNAEDQRPDPLEPLLRSGGEGWPLHEPRIRFCAPHPPATAAPSSVQNRPSDRKCLVPAGTASPTGRLCEYRQLQDGWGCSGLGGATGTLNGEA